MIACEQVNAQRSTARDLTGRATTSQAKSFGPETCPGFEAVHLQISVHRGSMKNTQVEGVQLVPFAFNTAHSHFSLLYRTPQATFSARPQQR